MRGSFDSHTSLIVCLNIDFSASSLITEYHLHHAVPAVLDHGEGEQHDAAAHGTRQELHLGSVSRGQLLLMRKIIYFTSCFYKITFLVEALLIVLCISAGAIKPRCGDENN